MKKGTIIAIVVGINVLLGILLISGNNSLVSMEAEVDAALANIDTNLQRRADLIPNLVNTVKGYAAHEQAAIDSVTEARAKLTGASTVAEKAERNLVKILLFSVLSHTSTARRTAVREDSTSQPGFTTSATLPTGRAAITSSRSALNAPES